MRQLVGRHKLVAAFVAAALVGGAAVVVFWFEPQQLFIDDEVDEAVPAGSALNGGNSGSDPGTMASTPAGNAEVRVLAEGTFRALDHDASGDASILKIEKALFLRFENFEVENGPDLRVYLSSAPASRDPAAFDDDFVDLGGLKGNIGNQNYALPEDVDLSKYRSAVVWCRRFSVGFAVADLGT